MASYKKYAISSGHGLHVRGASCYIDEVDEARKVVKQVTKLLKDRDCTVKEIHDNVSKTKAQNITNGRSSYLVKEHNSATREVDISVHFNANKKQDAPVGVEVLYVTDNMKAIASELSKAIANVGGFKNRGAKRRTDLSFLNCTDKPALLIETCFVDSKTDTELYKKKFNEICEAIAFTLSGKKAPTTSSITQTPTTSTNSNQIGVVKCLVDLNVHVASSLKSEVVKQLKAGGSYKCYKKERNMYNLGGNQWINGNPTVTEFVQLPFEIGTLQKDVEVTDNLNVRAGRGTEYEVIGKFTKGDIVNVWYVDKASNGSLWGSCNVNGKTGYINMKYASRI